MPRPPIISADRIIEAAAAIIDEKGVPALKMREIAARLGVDGSALYYHFQNKDAVLDAVIKSTLENAPWEPISNPKRGAISHLEIAALDVATHYVKALMRHPHLVNLVASRQRPFTFPIYDYFIAGMKRAGIPAEMRGPLIDAMEGFVIGWALFTVNQDHEISSVPPEFGNVREAFGADVLDPVERFRRVAELVIHGLLAGAARQRRSRG